MEFAHEVLDFARDQLGKAREQIQTLKVKMDYAEQIEKLWDEFLQYASRGWHMHMLELLNNKSSIIEQIGATDEKAMSVLKETINTSETESSIIIRRYPAHFEEACNKTDLPLDSDSRHPRYTESRDRRCSACRRWR